MRLRRSASPGSRCGGAGSPAHTLHAPCARLHAPCLPDARPRPDQGPPKARAACTARAGFRLTLTGVAPPNPKQVWQLARAVDDLQLPVMAYGLRVDFQGELFAGVG